MILHNRMEHMGSRSHFLFLSLFAPAILLGGNLSLAGDASLPKVTNLEDLGDEADDRKLPILLMFSMDGCPYCVILEDNYLLPMLRSGDYQDKVIIRMVKVDDYATLTDFKGNRVDAEDFSSRYGAYVTPTMVFLDNEGNEIAPRLVGIGTEGFFAGDIDKAIETALSRIRPIALK